MIFQGNLGESVLLSVWFLVHCLFDPGDKYSADINRSNILHALRRGRSSNGPMYCLRGVDPIDLYLQNYRWWWKSFIVSGGSAVYGTLFVSSLQIVRFIQSIIAISD